MQNISAMLTMANSIPLMFNMGDLWLAIKYGLLSWKLVMYTKVGIFVTNV